MTSQETSGQLGQVGVGVGLLSTRSAARWITQPVADENEALFGADDRPADGQAPDCGQRKDVDQRLSGDGHVGRRHDLAQLCAGHRPFSGERSLDGGDTSIGLSGRNPLLCKASGVAGGQLWRGEPLEPPVVLRADEVQGAPVQPGHHQSPLLELSVHVGRGEPDRAGPDREPRGAQILRLHRQQPVDDLDDTVGRRPNQELGCQPTMVTLAIHGHHGRYSRTMTVTLAKVVAPKHSCVRVREWFG